MPDTIWYIWTTGTASTSTASTWNLWNNTSVTTTNGTGDVWYTWVGQVPITAGRIRVPAYVPPTLTPEQVAAREEQNRVLREQAAARDREKSIARRKAARLLKRNLNKRQRRELRKQGGFRVYVRATKRWYKINRGWAGNVYREENGHAVERFCIHPVNWVPDEDNMLAQKLMLEAAEPDFRRIANITLLRAA